MYLRCKKIISAAFVVIYNHIMNNINDQNTELTGRKDWCTEPYSSNFLENAAAPENFFCLPGRISKTAYNADIIRLYLNYIRNYMILLKYNYHNYYI